MAINHWYVRYRYVGTDGKFEVGHIDIGDVECPKIAGDYTDECHAAYHSQKYVEEDFPGCWEVYQIHWVDADRGTDTWKIDVAGGIREAVTRAKREADTFPLLELPAPEPTFPSAEEFANGI